MWLSAILWVCLYSWQREKNFRALRHETCFTLSQNRQEVLKWVLCSCISVCVCWCRLMAVHVWNYLFWVCPPQWIDFCVMENSSWRHRVCTFPNTVHKPSPLLSWSFTACLTDSRRVSAFTCTPQWWEQLLADFSLPITFNPQIYLKK